MAVIRVATYNVHQWVGLDGRCDVPRVVDVIRELDADIVGLQEAVYPHEQDGEHGLDYIARRTETELILGPTLMRKNAHFGNILLSRLPVKRVRRVDLKVAGREPRGALDVDMASGDRTIRVVVAHLGLDGRERQYQVEKLLELVNGSTYPVILMGDFNVWFPRSRLLGRIKGRFGAPPAPRTFPSLLPVFRLDRIWALPTGSLSNMQTHVTRVSRMASDHLPVTAAFEA
jgi:endonuclease/exonuclease/phosphatase family metal-dependent hydrolase